MYVQVDNCPNCGSVYQKNLRNMCTSCSSNFDSNINNCLNYLWRNPKATTEELSNATKLEASIIYKFIKQGLITSKSFRNITYPCESCYSPIKENRICYSCSSSIRQIAQQINAIKPLSTGSGFKISERFRK